MRMLTEVSQAIQQRLDQRAHRLFVLEQDATLNLWDLEDGAEGV